MTRRFVRYGSSPRGAQAIILAAKIRAILDHRYHVAREDLRAVAHAALRHRLILNFEGQAENIQADDIIDDMLRSVPTCRRGSSGVSRESNGRSLSSHSPLVLTSHSAIRLRLPEEAGIPLAGLAAGLPRPAAGPAADDAARRGHRVRRPSRVHARRRLPLPRLERVRPARRTAC